MGDVIRGKSSAVSSVRVGGIGRGTSGVLLRVYPNLHRSTDRLAES
jgi:hypothetical protein